MTETKAETLRWENDEPGRPPRLRVGAPLAAPARGAAMTEMSGQYLEGYRAAVRRIVAKYESDAAAIERAGSVVAADLLRRVADSVRSFEPLPPARIGTFESDDPEPFEPLPPEDMLMCPAGCGGEMVERRRRSDGNPFFGCTRYPDCRETMTAEAAAAKMVGEFGDDPMGGF